MEEFCLPGSGPGGGGLAPGGQSAYQRRGPFAVPKNWLARGRGGVSFPSQEGLRCETITRCRNRVMSTIHRTCVPPQPTTPSCDRDCGHSRSDWLKPRQAAQGQGPPRAPTAAARPTGSGSPPAGRRTQRCRFGVSPVSASSGCCFVTNSRSFSAGTTHRVATAFSHVTPMSIQSANHQP